MSITEDEARFEEWMMELYEEHSKQALEEFRAERLQAYFLTHPELAKPAMDALQEARTLAGASSRAALVLATAASEVGVKTVLLRPVVFGLVHSESVAGLITDIVVRQRGMDRFKELLFTVLREYGKIDLDTYRRPNVNVLLWQEISDCQRLRNGAVHRADAIEDEQATRAINIAATVLETIFPHLVSELGLHLHNRYRVCDQYHPPPELANLLTTA